MGLTTSLAWSSATVAVALAACGNTDTGSPGTSGGTIASDHSTATGGAAASSQEVTNSVAIQGGSGGSATTLGLTGGSSTRNAGGASALCAPATISTGLSANSNCAPAVECGKVQCQAEVAACYGPDYANGNYAGGQCAAYLSCTAACNCESTCVRGCTRDEACSACQTAMSQCVQSSCATPIAQCVQQTLGISGGGGAGGAGPAHTCADLQTCCATLTGTTQSNCQAVYSAAVSYGDSVCNLAWSRFGC